MVDRKLNQRQLKILYFIRSRQRTTNLDIKKYLEEESISISRITITRDINNLLADDLIKREGKGRTIWYQEEAKEILRYFDVDSYFKQNLDQRNVTFSHFNFKIFRELKGLFNQNEIKKLKELNNDYLQRIKKLPTSIIKKEFERLTIDLSWKSSRIEGNTYSLIDTEILIKENKEAVGHKKEEAIMILNHKKALDYILNEKENFKKITVRKIEDIHGLLTQELGISKGVRKSLVGVVGTRYRPIDNEFQIKEALEKTVKIINTVGNPLLKSLIAILLISYIQPFEDGNKRTSRMLGNALLLAYSFCPLSFRSIEEVDYKKAMILFYEQNSARFFKELFIEQFNFATNNYFL